MEKAPLSRSPSNSEREEKRKRREKREEHPDQKKRHRQKSQKLFYFSEVDNSNSMHTEAH